MSAQGDRIKKLRRSLGMTQADFATNIGVKGGVVSAWEKGTAPVPYGRILILCEAYDVNERWLTSGVGDMFVDPKKRAAKTPKEHAEEYLFSIVDRLPPDARRSVVEFCRNALKRYDPDYEDDSDLDRDKNR